MAPVTETGIGLLCLCRQGFEPELAGELQFRAGEAGFAGYARTQRNDGYVLFMCDEAAALAPRLRWRELIFARQKLVVLAELPQLDPATASPRCWKCWPMRRASATCGWNTPIRTPASRCPGWRAFGNALRPALRKAGKLTDKPNNRLPRLHVVFVDGTHAFVCVADPADSAPWALGIPRLKLLPEAPSRSALKLDEALLTLLTPEEREALAKPGMRAADLGAAPGGWTWVLTRQHMHVLSIDNGPLRQHVLDTGLVEHLRADGFHWHPEQPLDWMVCDMVEQPRRVAERMATWFREGWCRHAIFNLKLPMKKRWDETRLCLDLFQDQAGKPLVVRAKQLYHDREEITVLASPLR
jgi:23S rRNA (cytidine2498-2'-O)-methyltransferase